MKVTNEPMDPSEELALLRLENNWLRADRDAALARVAKLKAIISDVCNCHDGGESCCGIPCHRCPECRAEMEPGDEVCSCVEAQSLVVRIAD